MTQNYYKTRLPFFRCIAFGDQPELQINKSLNKLNHFTPVANPKDWYPEFVFNRPWTPEAPSTMNVKVWNMDTDTQHVDFGILPSFTSIFKHYQVMVNGAARIVTMFTGLYDAVTTMPSGRYQYRITIGAYRFYSEIWEVCKLNYNQVFHPDFTRFVYSATCNFANINYNTLKNFKNNLWLPSEGIMPESVIEEENEQDLSGQTVSSSQKVTKSYLLSCPTVTDATVDAINTLPMYCDGDQKSLYVIGRNPYAAKTFVKDVQVENPDYSVSELCPNIKLRLQIDPTIVSNDCCDTSDIVSYTGISANPPVTTKISSTSIRVQKSFTFGDWIAENKIPAWSLVDVQYILNGGSPVQLPGPRTYLQLHAGFNVTGLAAGSYVFRIRIRTIDAATVSNWSGNSNAITLP